MRWVRESFSGVQPYKPGERASQVRRELGLERVVKLSSNESAFAPMASAARAMSRVVRSLNRYPDGGCGLLKKRLSDKLSCPVETLMVGNGSNELLRLLAAAVIEPGDEAVMAAPSFIVYPLVTKLHGAVVVDRQLKNLEHDLEAMLEAVGERTKIVFICNPNNPTGTVVPGKAIKDFLEAVPERVLVCVDEAYHEFVSAPGYESALGFRDAYPNLVVMRTFSKIYGLAGARVGYGVADPEIVEAIDKIREPFNVNTVAQVGAYYSLEDGAEIEKRKRLTGIERDFVQGGLDKLGLSRAESQANFVYFDCAMPAIEAFERLRRDGVIVRAFGNSSCIRATLGTRGENEILLDSLAKLHGAC